MNEEIKAKEAQEKALDDEELGGVTGGGDIRTKPRTDEMLYCTKCGKETFHESITAGIYKCAVCGTKRVGK